MLLFKGADGIWGFLIQVESEINSNSLMDKKSKHG
jgi:hypothetical protein